MRSRYSAYVRQESELLFGCNTSLLKEFHSKEDILAWARSNDWQKLEVLNSIDNTVEFKSLFFIRGIKFTMNFLL
jgi:SEC-C motif-containing protein